jgi:hypothetical protein
MKHAQIGSVSHGTLRNEDLLEAFGGELAHYARKNREELGQIETLRLLRLASEAENSAYYAEHEEEASELVNELMDELEMFAPPYCHFGAHEGDGSDFGFWPCLDAIEELPQVDGSDTARELGEDACFVNDHGNVTVYGADGAILLEIV